MGWIKRNLFFTIGGIVALGLLGAAGFYNFQSWRDNQAAFDKLNEIYSTLKEVGSRKPSPGNDKVDNIATAKEQNRQLLAWIDKAKNYFQPIPPIPDATNGYPSSEMFADALHKTIAELQREAADDNVAVPTDYAFSFKAEESLVKFAPGSLQPLSVQLGEVKAISEVIFSARVNQLDGIQRVAVSADDAAGPQADYFADQSTTNNLAVLTPYQVTFRSFTPELAQVLAAFASSPHCFIVKAVNVQPAEAAASAGSAQGAAPQMSTPGPGGMQMMLNEQMLRITLEVEIVKLLPKK